MRKKILILIAASAAALLLTACTQKDTSGVPASAGAGTGASGSGTVAASSDKVSQTGESAQDGTAASAGQNEASASAENTQAGGNTQNAAPVQAGNAKAGGGMPTGSASAASGDDGGVSPEDTFDAASQGENSEINTKDEPLDGAYSWTGTFESPSGESVDITEADDGGSISFQFADSGITGIAKITDGQAVFDGDDGYEVTFVLDEDTVTVNVTGENDTDGSDSPIVGIYTRQ